jgi:RecB family exonuclease
MSNPVQSIRLSARALTDFQRCSQQYGLATQSARPPVPLEPTPALSVGNSLHAALKALYSPGAPLPAPDFYDEVVTVLRRHWVRAGFENEAQEAEWFASALDALLRLVFEFGAPAGQILGVEADLWARISHDNLHFTLTGRLDRLELLPDGTLEILDYKAHVSGFVITPEALAEDLGMFAYYILARLRYPQYSQVRVAQLNLFSRQRTAIEYDDQQRNHNKATLLAAVADIAAERWVPRPGAWCDWCPVRERCPAFQYNADWEDV